MALIFDFINPEGIPEIVLKAVSATAAEKILLHNIAAGKYGEIKVLSSKSNAGIASEVTLGFTAGSLFADKFSFPECRIYWKSGESTEGNILDLNGENPQPSTRKKLWLSSPEELLEFSPKLKIERYTKARNRGKNSNATPSGWSEVPGRITGIPVLADRQEIVFDAEDYFRAKDGKLKAKGSPEAYGQAAKVKIRFRLSVIFGGKEIVSAPFGKIQMTAKKEDEIIRINYSMI